jgi:hypothetical protein
VIITKKYLLILLVVFTFGQNFAFGHGVYGGIAGCPVGGCGKNYLHELLFMSDITFATTLIVYCLILATFLIPWGKPEETRKNQ